MPSFAPTSTWACGSKSKVRGVPHFRTSTFALSSAPSGTLGCSRFGRVSECSRMPCSMASSSASRALMRSAPSATRCFMVAASSGFPAL